MSPTALEIPMLLNDDLYKIIQKFQDYKDNWIIDFTSIDPKVTILTPPKLCF